MVQRAEEVWDRRVGRVGLAGVWREIRPRLKILRWCLCHRRSCRGLRDGRWGSVSYVVGCVFVSSACI